MDAPKVLAAKRQLSLRWKILLPCVLIFAVITGLMVLQSWRLLSDQLQTQTREQLAGDERVLTNLFAQLRSEYGHIGTELAGVVDTGRPQALSEYIENSPDIFARLNWMRVHAEDGRELAQWAPAGVQPQLPPIAQQTLLEEARREMRPIGSLHCGQSCEYLLAMPGNNAEQLFFMMLATPLTEILPSYTALTGGEIALLAQGQAQPLHLVARTMGDQLSVAKILGLAIDARSRSEIGEVALGPHYFAYRHVDLSTLAVVGEQIQALLFRNLSLRRAEVRAQAIRQLLIDLLVVLAGMLALFLLLTRSLERLRRVTAVLPHLSDNSNYALTRKALAQASPPSRLGDEVDALRETLDWLSTRLEALHGAEAASEAKSRFLATMSHEIRTPMSGILGLTEILSRAPLSPEHQRMATMIHESTVNLLSIINDVLDYSRLEAGAAQLDLVEFDPLRLLESVTELVAVNAARKNLCLQVLVPPDLPAMLRGDQGKLRQILLNLVSNAIKFTEQGRVTLRLHTEWQVQGHASFCFEVEDTGIGVPKAAQEKIFGRFSQADSSTTRRFGGTGLGLAISTGLAGLMGGELTLESEPERGSCFKLKLELPVVEAPVAPASVLQGFLVDLQLAPEEAACWAARLRAAGAQIGAWQADTAAVCLRLRTDPQGDQTRVHCLRREAGGETTSALERPVRLSDLPARLAFAAESPGRATTTDSALAQFSACVLVAEDHAVNRELLSRQLGQLGCEVLLSENGVEALEVLRQHSAIDLLITDLHMPKMDGYQLAQAIRASDLPLARSLPIIVLTASASPQDLSRLGRYGIQRKLIKPVRIADLARSLEEIGLPQLVPEPPSDAPPPAPTGASAGGAPVLDLELVRDVLGEDLSVLGSYVQMFEESSRPQLAQCREALAAQDWAALKERVHRVKGSSRSLGGRRLGETLAAIEGELQGDVADLAHLSGLLDRAEEEFEQFLAAARQLAA